MATGALHDYYDCLEQLGFTKGLAEKRVKISENAAECFARVTQKNYQENVQVLIPGSRGEGVAVLLNSDLDIVFLQPSVMCFERYPAAESSEDKHNVLFRLDLNDVPEGYAKLELISIRNDPRESRKMSNFKDRIKRSLVDQKYLRNDRKLIDATELGSLPKPEGFISKNYQFDEKSGPSQPLHFPLAFFDFKLSMDYVAAFPCSYPSLFDEWYKRERAGIWPTIDDIEDIKKTGIFVVPVGKAGSEEESLQWRISFTLAERHLVRSFNDTQIKAYVAMKMLCKHELKPICENITTYVVKNVMFGVYEKHPGTFTRDEFKVILVQAMQDLKTFVEKERLDNYIIPYRNLLLGKISEKEKNNLISRLGLLRDEGLSALYRCPLLKEMLSLKGESLRGEMSGESLDEKLLHRRLADELILSVFSIEPKKYDEIEHEFHVKENALEILLLYLKYIFPDIRNNNPFGYFWAINSLTKEGIMDHLFKVARMSKDDILKEWIFE